MLKSLTLTNFRQHEDRVFNFTPGLNILRGANESGKSTCYEAIGYALFGSGSLRESLEDVVTYDKPSGSLKVSLTFEIDGVEYTAVRGKSGAEITYADHRVTGQKETRLFCERLFSCSVDTFSRLSLASQGDVKGVLADGASATNGLVETLANLKIIEELVDKIQNQKPSGNTTAISQQISAMQVGEKPLAPVLQDTQAKAAEMADLLVRIDLANSRLPAEKDVVDTTARVQNAAEIARDRQKQENRNSTLRASLKPIGPAPCTQGDVDAARDAVANAAEEDRVRKAYAIKFTVCDKPFEGSYVEFEQQIEKLSNTIAERLSLIAELNGSINAAKKALVKSGTTCPTCKQELPDAASIEKHNTEHEALIAKDEALREEATKSHNRLDTRRKELLAIQRVEQHNKTLTGNGVYWNLDSSKQVPGIPVWRGDPPTEAKPLPDPKAMQASLLAHEKAVTEQVGIETSLAEPLPEVPDASADEAWLADYAEQVKALHELRKQSTQAGHELQMLELANRAALNAYESEVLRWEQQVETLQRLKSTLSEMVKHNDLIKKLRGVRPQIATKLWGTVLGAVSHYTSAVRGEASLVTRDEDGFKVNGRKAKGLSGSGQDAMGLGIRVALTKVFLPGAPFLLADEVFAACDDGREINGLAMLASSGFDQVVLVTHSSLGDSLADNLIQL